MNPGPFNRIVVLTLAALFVGYSVFVHLESGEPPASVRMNDRQARGFEVWRKNNCQVCHQIYGSGGYLGPDLTNVASRRSERRIHLILTQGSAPMPRFDISREDRAALIEFFKYVDKTGTWPRRGWPPPDFTRSED